jgi:integrase
VGRIRIARSLTVVNKKIHEGPTKTHQVRDVALDESGIGVLLARWAYMMDLSERAESPLYADPYVLSQAAHGGLPVDPNKLTCHFAALCTKLEARDNGGIRAGEKAVDANRVWTFRFHDLRHSSVTTLIAAGVDIRTVTERHGHARATVLLNR